MTDPACYRVGLEHYPGLNPFVLDWLRGDQRFLKRDVGPPPSAAVRTGSAAGGGGPAESFTNALIESNRRWGLDVADEVRRWASGGTYTVIAGQQVGFAGGPLYTIAKIASLLKMKRNNEAQGIPTTVFFWLATEDHDFDEVATVTIPNGDPKRQTDLIALHAPRFGEPKRVVGSEQIPEALIQQFLSAAAIERPAWLRENITFGDSFAELLATAVREKFILVDSMLPELRRAGAPLTEAILARWREVQDELETRSAALKKAGYSPQVVPRPGEGYSLLFRLQDDGTRELLHPRASNVPPERISTSALTRPLLQDFVLRPDVFVGGPAEVAYFAQIAPLHDLFDVPMPRVALRAHILVGTQATLRRFSKYAIDPSEVFTNADALLASREPRAVTEIRSIAAEAERHLGAEIEKIRGLSLPADHAVARSINRSIGHINYHFRKLTERSIRALVRKDRERYEAARDLISTFYPDHHVQDRIVAWVPFWARYGNEFVDRLIAEAEPDAPFFKIVGM